MPRSNLIFDKLESAFSNKLTHLLFLVFRRSFQLQTWTQLSSLNSQRRSTFWNLKNLLWTNENFDNPTRDQALVHPQRGDSDPRLGTTAIDFIDQYTPLNICRQEKGTAIHLCLLFQAKGKTQQWHWKNTSIYKVQRLGHQLHCITFPSSTTLNLSHIHPHLFYLQPPVVHLQTVGSEQLFVSGSEASAARIIYSPPKKKITFYNVTWTWTNNHKDLIWCSWWVESNALLWQCCHTGMTMTWANKKVEEEVLEQWGGRYSTGRYTVSDPSWGFL